MARKSQKSDWVIKLSDALSKLSKDELVAKIVEQRKETYSKVGKRNVATAKSHERRCKKLLTEWSGVEFRRRRVEGRGDDVRVVEGVADVIPVDGEVAFAIECKKGDSFSIDALCCNPENTTFTKWWHQCSYDAKLLTDKTGVKRWPLMFFKPHPNWDWIAVPRRCFETGMLHDTNRECWFPHFLFDYFARCGPIEHDISASKNNPVMYAMQLEPSVLCRWRDFAAEVDPKRIFV